MNALIVPLEADRAQRRCTDPHFSVFVSANAGAGKTHVLSQRVLRLLLAGVDPGAILCLTYTNAAAAEMAGRVYKALAHLATLNEPNLRQELQSLGAPTEPADMRRARTLFALTIETPGGLKVSTVHAFAAALLRRFPLEANVSGAFTILDDPTRQELTAAAISTTLAEAAEDPDGAIAQAITALLPRLSDASLPATIEAVLNERGTLLSWVRRSSSAATLARDLKDALGVDDTALPSRLTDEDVDDLLTAMRAEKKVPQKAAAYAAILQSTTPAERDQALCAALLNQDGTPSKKPASKAALTANPHLGQAIEDEQIRLVALRLRDAANGVISSTVPLIQLAETVLGRIETEKRRRGLIDYDDQIEKARNLVATAAAAAWVRYKLDNGVDHILLDEAQDTAPAQWDLVDALCAEFFAGEGARDTARTLFVVGDEKQSIYSFQGAAPRLFGEKRGRYSALAHDAALPFAPVELAHSFRSAPQILSAVDAVFADPELKAAVGADAADVIHQPVREISGGVDVWPLIGSDVSEAPPAWDAPLDATTDGSGPVKLVKAIADQIEAWAKVGPDGGPPVDPGNVLILSRNRGSLAGLMNSELKARGIPAAGADRLNVIEHIAVKDMLALARSLLTRDDLSLAAALKSPLFRFDDEALFQLAHNREGSLFHQLSQGDEAARAAHDTLTRWRTMARHKRPFDFFAGILIGEGRRADFAAQLGSEAEDALDAFLDLALDSEGTGIPALDPFVHKLTKLSTEIRRLPEDNDGKVRVMTVHGAKGLEADVVFLADMGAGVTRSTTIIPLPLGESDHILALAPPKAECPAAIDQAIVARQEAEIEEEHRLLYVAMTRARRHLVVCGAYKKKEPSKDKSRWHKMVWNGLEPQAAPRSTPFGEGLAWRIPPAKPRSTDAGAPPTPRSRLTIPSWLDQPPPERTPPPKAMTPSGSQSDAVSFHGEDRVIPAALHGTLVHGLIETGGEPVAMREAVQRRAPDAPPEAVDAIVQEARQALTLLERHAANGTCQHAEVPIIGDVRLEDGTLRRAHGRVDRLLVGDDTLIVDFKTDRLVPDTAAQVPRHHLHQMSVYKALVGAMGVGEIRTALVYTAAPKIVFVDDVLPNVEAVPTPA
ncbi:MAG: double-strand break repair helicase AddA [Pseudomonadota bacterium]